MKHTKCTILGINLEWWRTWRSRGRWRVKWTKLPGWRIAGKWVARGTRNWNKLPLTSNAEILDRWQNLLDQRNFSRQGSRVHLMMMSSFWCVQGSWGVPIITMRMYIMWRKMWQICVMDIIIFAIDVRKDVVVTVDYWWVCGRCYRDGVHKCSRKCMH